MSDGLDVSSGYHLYPDKEIFEIVDPETGEVQKEGEDGELSTPPLIRCSSLCVLGQGFCESGITYEPCPYCKRTVPRISSILPFVRRQDLQLSKIKGLGQSQSFARLFLTYPKWMNGRSNQKEKYDPYEVDELIIYLSVKENVNRSN